MTKKLLPTMIGAALVAGVSAASADVTVFGHIDTAITNFDNNTTGLNSDDTRFVCTTCSIGFKGSEDLGNGLKAIFSLDFQYDTTVRNDGDGTSGDGDNDNSALVDRDQWVGLAGGFGKVRIGTISTVYKSHGAMIDPLYRTALQGREHGLQSSFHTGAGEELQGRATNTVRWDSADFNGIKVGAHYTLDSNESTEDENPYGIGGSYENGGILVFADWMDNAQSGVNESSVWKVGGKYSMNDFAVMGQYEDEEYGNNGGEYRVWHIAGSYTMGNNMIYAGFGNTEDETNSGNVEDTDAWTIALMHSMSKRTKAYVGYNNQEDDVTNSEYDEFSVGIKHKF
jgi:predicted porin